MPTPAAPTILEYYHSSGSITLTWSSAYSNFTIYYGTSTPPTTVYSNPSGVSQATVSGLTNNTLYYIAITAWDDLGNESSKRIISDTPTTTTNAPSAPTLYSATGGNAHVDLSLLRPQNAGSATVSGLKVYYGTSDPPGTQFGSSYSASTTDVAVTGLTNGTLYYFGIKATNSVGDSGFSTIVSATPSTTPGAPSLGTITAGNAQIVVNWSAPSDNGGSAITGYKVYYGTSSPAGTQFNSTYSSGTTQATITGLTNGTAYYVGVLAVNANGDGSKVTSSGTYTPQSATVPSAPNKPSVSQSCNGVHVVWSEPNNGGSTILNYKIYYGTTTSPTTLGATITYTGGIQSGDVSSPSPCAYGTQYYVRVTATNSVGESSYSTVSDPITPICTPAAPTGVSADGNTCGHITLSWNAADGQGATVTGYRIWYGTTANPITLYTTLGNVLTTDVSASLTKGTTYYFKVSAINSVGDGANSSVVNAVLKDVPDAPTTAAGTSLCNSTLRFTWAAPANNGGSAITGYKVYYETNTSPLNPGTNVGNVLTTDVVLTPGSTYYLRVKAVNACGDSGFSTVSSGILCTTVPGIPTIGTSVGACGKVTANWTAPASDGGTAITGYKVYWATSAGGTYTLGNTVGVVTTADITTGLAKNTTYYLKVLATNACGDGNLSSASNGVVFMGVPDAPTIGTSSSGCGYVRANWSAPANNGGSAITGYKIYWATSVGGSYTLGNTVGAVLTGDITSGLTKNTTYYLKVIALNACGDSTISSASNGVVFMGVPDAPTMSAVTGICNSSIRITWSAPANDGGSAITGYKLYYGTNSNPTSPGTNVGNVLTYDVSSLTKNTTYYARVIAVNACGDSGYATQVSGTCTSVPDAPTLGTITPGNAQIVVNWSAPANNGGSAVTGYTVWYGTDSNATSQFNGTYSAGTTQTTITGLANGSAYYVGVIAVNGCGNSSKIVDGTYTPYTVPSAPGAPSTTAGCSQVGLTWSAPANNGSTITGYKVYYGTTSNPTTLFSSPTGLSETVTGLNPGTLYYFAISAVNAAGEGAKSSNSTATPFTTPGTIGTPSASDGCSSATVSWSAPSNGGSVIDYYQVYYGTSSDPTTPYASTTATTSQTLTGLGVGITYYFRVKAHNACGLAGTYSANCTAVPHGVPNTVTGLTLDSTGCSSMSVHWDAPSNNGSIIDYYTIYADHDDTTPTVQYGTTASTSATLTNLTPGLVWSVRIKAHNACGSSGSYSSVVSTTPYDIPGAPTIGSATPENGQSTVSWTAPASDGGTAVDYYQVYYGTSASPTTPFGSTTASTSQLITGLTNGTLYYFRVKAHNSCGLGAYSADTTALILGGMSFTGGIFYSRTGFGV